MINKFILFVLSNVLIIMLTTSSAATYYIDAVSGNNSNSGLSPTVAWKTISKVNSSTFNPGDQILFKSGQKWREQLNLSSSGTSANPIIISSYNSGQKPIISGAEVITGFTIHSGNVWKKNTTYPHQVLYNEIRGVEQTSLAAVNADKKWFYDKTSSTLYLYSVGNPSITYSSPGIEVCARLYSIYLTQDYITIQNLQLEKTSNSAIKITSSSQNIIVDNASIYQWSVELNWEFDGDSIHGIGGIDIYGNNCEVKNSTFGKNTGNDIADQNWAGLIAIFIHGANSKIHHNNIYHTSVENESSWGNKSYGIRITKVSGTTEVFNNYIYHTGGHAILVRSNTSTGDIIRIYNNIIEYTGQAGISAYQTRREDGIGGTGYIYGNKVSFANRLGGDVGGGGTQSSGIHLNNGVRRNTDPKKPYMKWYVYENTVHNSQAPKKPNSLDSDGIGLDYNADEVEVFRNLVYNNWGKGIYLWNVNRCKAYYNIVYGNDAGTTVTSATNTIETAEYNEVYNNTYYKNYNTNAYGPNYDCEIYFGGNGKYNVFKNNILYGHTDGVVYYYRAYNTIGEITDNNIVYKDGGNYAWDPNNLYQSYTQWRANYPQFDANSINANPQFVNAAQGNFNLQSTSPAINKGVDLGFDADFYNNIITDKPDIGAVEYIFTPVDNTPPAIQSVVLVNSSSLKITYSEKVQTADAQTASNYSINNGVSVISAILNSEQSEVTLTTTSHPANQSFSVTINNVRDVYGNVISSPGNTHSYNNIQVVDQKIILLNANAGTLSGDARLGSMTGMKNTRAVYFQGTNGGVSFNVSIPSTGTWYAWARMYYMSSGGKNSFLLSANSGKFILGDDDSKYNQWHWDGYIGSKIDIGSLAAGQTTIVISGREPGLTLWVDQVVLTNDPNFIPSDNIETPPPPSTTSLLLNANSGTLSGDARLGSMTGMKNTRAVYFQGTNGGVSFNVSIPSTGTWYAWARMYYMSSGGKNSFFFNSKSVKYILGDNDNKYNQWHWDGYQSVGINLGSLTAGSNTIMISGREPGLTLWVDQIIITNDPDYFPTDNNIPEPPLSAASILLNANSGTLSGDARLGSMTGMKNTRAVYFQGTNGGVSFNVSIPSTGTWYAWARMYYMSSGGKNSFFFNSKSVKYILGDNDNKYNQWHWDGYQSVGINLGSLTAGSNTIMISGREPGLTLWVDQIIITNDPDYNPAVLGKENNQEIVLAEQPSRFELNQNYPNPFNPSTIIRFSIPQKAYVSLKVFDITGTEVANLIDEEKAPGFYNINFNGADLASGIYIYRIIAGDFIKSNKMQLIK